MSKILTFLWVCATPLLAGGGSEEAFATPDVNRKQSELAASFDPALPNILIIGDSISMGYTPRVRQTLSGSANVLHAGENCKDTKNGKAKIDKWLGTMKWDVIHFNFGLHDLCYRHPESKLYGHRDKEKGTIGVPIDQYETNLEEIVQRLMTTGATLIWASTTKVPDGEAGRFVGDDIRYNQVAQRIMKRHNVMVNDLHATTASFDPSMFQQPGDVHYKEGGSRRLAEQVAQCLSQVLPSK